MNTEYLKEFVVLAETRNFWEASERLYMNQSTLSKHIRMLETELSADLFIRTTRRVQLTDYGRAYLPYARAAIKAEQDGFSAIRRLKEVKNGLLTIGSIPSMQQYRITQLIARYQQQYPAATVRITEDDPTRLTDYLMDESCELIFLREDKVSFENNFLNNAQIRRIPYMQDRMVVLMQKSHPLAGGKSIDIKQLKDEKFCLLKEGTLIYDLCMTACGNAGFTPNIIFTSHRIDSILDMVANENCVALLMDKHVGAPGTGLPGPDSPLTAVELTPEICSQISICCRADRPLSEAAQKFLEINDKKGTGYFVSLTR